MNSACNQPSSYARCAESVSGATLATALRSATLSGLAAPSRILLAPWGTVETVHGDFVLDDESVRLAVEAFEGHGTDLPIDFEHQTLGGAFASPTGQAPAAGWIKRLVGDPGVGLLAEIEWTDEGRTLVTGKQYRYLSPVAIIRKADRKLVAIHSAALTNKPAIVGMRPIVNTARPADDEAGQPSSELEGYEVPVLHSPIGASSPQPIATSPVETITGSSDGSIPESPHPESTAGQTSLEVLRAELDLPAETEIVEVLVAAGNRIAQLRTEQRRRHVAERVQQAVRAGKLLEAQRVWATALIARDEAAFEEWFRTAPVVIECGATTPPSLHRSADGKGPRAAAQSRAEYRGNPLLRRLTSEEAYIEDALRRENSE